MDKARGWCAFLTMDRKCGGAGIKLCLRVPAPGRTW